MYNNNNILQQSIDKHVLFYSKHCRYSKDAVSMINSNGLRNRFYLVNVEDFASTLPPFVKSVPLIFNKAHEILIDDDLFVYLQSLNPKTSSSTTSKKNEEKEKEKEKEKEEDLNPYQFGEDNFSFIDDVQDPDEKNKAFSFLDDDTSTATDSSAKTRPPDPVDTRTSDKDLSSILDRYKAERDFD